MALRSSALMMVLGLCLLSSKGSVGEPHLADEEHNIRQALTEHLLSVHNRLVIPKTPVPVSYGLDLFAIEEVNEKDNKLRISAFATIKWSDHRLQWDPANYTGIYSVTLPLNSIWRPDLTSAHAQVLEEEVNLSVVYDGSVFSYIPVRLSLPCSYDFSDYPYDSHTCDMKMESWAYSGSQLNLTIDEATAASTYYHRENSQWELLSFKAEREMTVYPCCPNDPYIHLLYRIHFKRTVGEYEIRAVIPSVVTSLLILLCFLIPPLSGGRMVLCSVVILGLLLLLHDLNQTVPIRGANAPFLADFLCFSVFLAFFAAIESVVAMNLSSWGTWSGSNSNSKTPKDGEELVAQPKPSVFLMQLARIIDLVCFVVFTVIFAIAGAIILNPKQPE